MGKRVTIFECIILTIGVLMSIYGTVKAVKHSTTYIPYFGFALLGVIFIAVLILLRKKKMTFLLVIGMIVISFIMTAINMGKGTQTTICSRLISNVLRITCQTSGSWKMRWKFAQPTHLLPDMPLRGLKFLNAMTILLIGANLNSARISKPGIRNIYNSQCPFKYTHKRLLAERRGLFMTDIQPTSEKCGKTSGGGGKPIPRPLRKRIISCSRHTKCYRIR